MINNFANITQPTPKEPITKASNNDIYMAPMKFQQNQKDFKIRPVMVISDADQNNLIVAPITSQMLHKSEKIQAKYAPIDNYQHVGLNKPSYIDVDPYSFQKINVDQLDNQHHFQPLDHQSQRNVNRQINQMISQRTYEQQRKQQRELGVKSI